MLYAYCNIIILIANIFFYINVDSHFTMRVKSFSNDGNEQKHKDQVSHISHYLYINIYVIVYKTYSCVYSGLCMSC